MRRCVLAVLALSLLASSAVAGIRDFLEFEATYQEASTENVPQNWAQVFDGYYAAGLTARLYAIPLTELSFTAERTWYLDEVNLNNNNYRGAIRVIPTSPESRTTLMVTADVSKRHYRAISSSASGQSNANQFTSTDSHVMASLGRRLNDRLSVRAGYNLKMIGYKQDGVKDRYDNGLFAGLNISLPFRAAFDIEAGYQFGEYQYLNAPENDPPRGIQPQDVYSVLTEGKLKYWLLSPRLSKAITRKTGVSLTFSTRHFINPNKDAVVYGNSAQRAFGNSVEGVVSPWADVYEGEYVKLGVKTHDIPGVVVSASFGCWDKQYLTTLEPLIYDSASGQWQQAPIISTYFVKNGRGDRKDNMRKVNLTILIPLNQHTYYIEPALKIDYTNNNSTIVVYDYDDFSFSAELRVRF